MHLLKAGLTLLGSGIVCAPALAQSPGQGTGEPRNFVRGGLSYLQAAEDVEVTIAGAPVDGADVELDGATAVHAEYGRYLTDAISVSLTFNGPFKTDNIAAGALAGSGNIATDTFGVASLGGQWHFNRDGVISPYVGGGLAYFHVFEVEDGIAVNAEIDNSFGGMLQAGVEAQVADNAALFVDVRRMFLETDSRGTLTGFPVTVKSRLDPVVISAGVTFAF